MKRLFFIFFIVISIFGCNDKDNSQTSPTYVIILGTSSYELEEDAYGSLKKYLEYLEEYYVSLENLNDKIKEIEILIGLELDNIKSSGKYITLSEVEKAIENVKNKGENTILPNIPGIEVTKPLTLLAYLVANNNLDDDILANVGAMYDGMVDMKEPATLLVYWDGKTSIGANKMTHLVLKYETDGKGNINGMKPLDETASLDEVLEMGDVVKEYSTQLSTDKTVMTKVLNDMITFSPTERLGLVVGSHASSWLNTIFMSRSRAFGQDGSGTDNTITIDNMAEAIEATGKKFEFILFDACFMGTVEVGYTYSNVADYQIASVMEVPAYGFPYDVLMRDLYKGTIDGYKKVCQSYTDFYAQRFKDGHQAWASIALVDSKEMKAMTDLIRQEITEHKDALSDYDVNVLQEYGRQGGPDIAYDLEQFIRDLNGGTVPESFENQLKKTILYKGCLEKAKPNYYSVDVSNYCGMGIYIPIEERSKWNAYFKTIDWFTVSGWNEVDFSWNF